jgi:hypothetical protein
LKGRTRQAKNKREKGRIGAHIRDSETRKELGLHIAYFRGHLYECTAAGSRATADRIALGFTRILATFSDVLNLNTVNVSTTL